MSVYTWIPSLIIFIIGYLLKIYILIPIAIFIMAILIYSEYVFNTEFFRTPTKWQLIKSLLWW